VPDVVSTALGFTNLPAIAFRPEVSTAPWSVSGGGLVATSPETFTAPLMPAVNDLFRELDVYLDAAGQTGSIRLTRYSVTAPGTTEDLASGVYPSAVGPLIFHLDHRADPMFWSYAVSVELKPGVVLYGANVWYFPLGGRFVQLTPQRVYDSRLQDGKLDSGHERRISLEGILGAPGSALINVTLDQTEGGGYLTVWGPTGEDGSGTPATSNINWSTDNEILANLAVVKLVGEHFDEFAVRAGGPGRTHIIVDVMGYFM
jgi:hypothetical protein